MASFFQVAAVQVMEQVPLYALTCECVFILALFTCCVFHLCELIPSHDYISANVCWCVPARVSPNAAVISVDEPDVTVIADEPEKGKIRISLFIFAASVCVSLYCVLWLAYFFFFFFT